VLCWFEHSQYLALARRLQLPILRNGLLPFGGFRYAPSPEGQEPTSRLGSTQFTDNLLHRPSEVAEVQAEAMEEVSAVIDDVE
jgi:hypothetical protein